MDTAISDDNNHGPHNHTGRADSPTWDPVGPDRRAAAPALLRDRPSGGRARSAYSAKTRAAIKIASQM